MYSTSDGEASFPEVLARSGALLREIGTTNRTRASDYEQAIGPDTALLLRVHQSNFRVVGFTELPTLAQLAAPLRTGEPPVVGIVRDGKLLLDCRTLADDEVDEVASAVAAARA